jgi:hypothetical protein
MTFAVIFTALRIAPYVLRLLLFKRRYHTSAPPTQMVPMRYAAGAVPRFADETLVQLGRRIERRAA